METVASLIVGCASTPAGVLMTIYFLGADQYRNVKHYKTWVHIVDKFKGKYARIKLEMKGRGQDAGYVYSGKILEVAYVKKK